MEIKDLEIWKPVVGYEGSYEVSNCGNVRGLDRIKINSIGRKQHTLGKIMTKRLTHWGYLKVDLTKYINGKSSTRGLFVHRVVAEAFIENGENKSQVNHKNGIKTDNILENLEWNTQSENQKHAVKTGLKVIGKGYDCNTSKLTKEQVAEIQNIYVFRKTKQIDLGKRYGVSVTTIKKALSNGYVK